MSARARVKYCLGKQPRTGVAVRTRVFTVKAAKRLGSKIFSEEIWFAIKRSLRLSARQLQIVRAIFDDQIDFAIAAELQISQNTVHTHINRLHRKLGVINRVELVLHVTQEFLRLSGIDAAALSPACIQTLAPRPIRALAE